MDWNGVIGRGQRRPSERCLHCSTGPVIVDDTQTKPLSSCPCVQHQQRTQCSAVAATEPPDEPPFNENCKTLVHENPRSRFTTGFPTAPIVVLARLWVHGNHLVLIRVWWKVHIRQGTLGWGQVGP